MAINVSNAVAYSCATRGRAMLNTQGAGSDAELAERAIVDLLHFCDLAQLDFAKMERKARAVYRDNISGVVMPSVRA